MFSGLYYLVTGGTSGIGAATSEKIISEGGTVIAGYNSNNERASLFVKKIKEKYDSEVILFQGNLCIEENVTSLIKLVNSTLNGKPLLGGLIHCAGFAPSGLFEKHLGGGDEILELMDTFYRLYPRALVQITEGVLPLMAEGRGRIVMISTPGCDHMSVPRAFYELPGQGKAAAEAIIRFYALRLAPRKITANVVIPGITNTDEWWMDEQKLQEYAERRSPMKELLQPAAIANVIGFLLSEAAQSTTGAVIPVDGGLCLV